MRKILRLSIREYLAAVRTKGFIIGLVLAPVLMGGGFIAILIAEKKVDVKDKKIAVIDRSGEVAQAIVTAAEKRNKNEIRDEKKDKKIKPAYIVEIVEPNDDDPDAQRLELSDRVRKKEIHAFLEIGPDVVHPSKNRERSRVAYYGRNAALDDMRRWLDWPINYRLRRLRLEDAGIDEDDVKDLFTRISVQGLGLVSVDPETGKVKKARRSNEIEAVMVPMVLMMLMFMMIMMGAVPLLHSVMEEKNQRIAEVLLGSVRPFEFMMGKVLGGVGISLTAAAVYVVGGVISIDRMGLGEFIPYSTLPWFFTYMILSIVMIGAVMAALGAACNDAKEAQSISFPAMLPVIIPMFVWLPVAKEPLSAFSTGMSLFPPFTPMLMLLRQTTPGGIPFWQPVVGFFGVCAFTLLAVWAGGRIFRVAILVQGQPPKIRNLLRWAIRG